MEIKLVEEEKSLVVQEKEELKVLDEAKAAAIIESYQPHVDAYVEIEPKVTTLLKRVEEEGCTPEICLDAKELRLAIRGIRTGSEKVKTEQKAVYLKVGGAVQGVYNIIKKAVESKEEALLAVEEYFIRIEEAKKAKIAEERKAELDKYEYDYSNTDLVNMDDAFWNVFFTGVKTAWQAQKDAEAKEEADRLAQEEANRIEQERIRAENETLRKEAEAREREAAAERLKAAEALRVEREAREAAEKKEADRIKAEQAEASRVKAEEAKQADAPDVERLETINNYLRQQYAEAHEVRAKNAIAAAGKILLAAIIDMKATDGE